jgi:peptidyl-prolyl cis-trans isomerase SurA
LNIKSFLLGASLAATFFAAPLAQSATQMLDQVVAIVDDDIIMASELRQRLAAVHESLDARGIEAPPEETLIRETLDRLILENIQVQKGRRVGVRISDAQLNGAMERVAAQNGLTLEQFRVALEQSGQSYNETREQIRKEMIIQRVQSGHVNQRIEISEQEIENFLATEEGQKMSQPEYRLVHALLPVSPDASDAQMSAAEAQVNKILVRIRGGEPFDQAVSASSSEYTFSGGDLGWRKLDDLPSLLSDVAPTLKIGEAADPIRSDSGFHLVKLEDMRGGQQMVDQTRARHILIKPSEITSDAAAQAVLADLKQRIVEGGEDFGALAREYSEDIGSAQEGGELGWVSPGQMVPEFEQAMRATAVGEVSDPVRSQFGWHILEVEERRNHDMTDQLIRSRVGDYLHRSKYQEELDAWLRQIRDEAFVDIK